MFLDRDGVLNVAVYGNGLQGSPRSLADLEIAPDAPAALASLKAAGFRLIGVTNQPEVPRGQLSRDAADAINAAVRAALPLDDLLMCCHEDADACHCRKPKPGLLLEGARRHDVDLAASFMVGDRWRDVEAGAAAGCRTVLLHNPHDDRRPASAPDASVASLAEAAAWILSQAAPESAP